MIRTIIKILIAIVFLALFGIAGEWDYQDQASRNQTTQY